MPDLTQSDRLRELRAVFPQGTRELQTMELVQTPVETSDQLDIVFAIDTTGSMTSLIDDIKAIMADVATGISSRFTVVRYALVSFKDEFTGETEVVTGADFVSLATFETAIDTLVASGGGDTPENGYGAVVLGCRLPWKDDTIRAMILVTDAESHERGQTLVKAKQYLLRESVVFFTYTDVIELTSYTELEEVTYGEHLVGDTAEELTDSVVAALTGIGAPLEAHIYLVADNASFTANLETGQLVTFLPRSFAIDPFTSGEEGTISIPLKIDNTDLAVSRYIQRAKVHNLPIEARLRIYDSSVTTGPQNDPPLRLFATEFEISGSTVSCQLRWIDVHNAVFPNEYYTPTRCPSLQ